MPSPLRRARPHLGTAPPRLGARHLGRRRPRLAPQPGRVRPGDARSTTKSNIAPLRDRPPRGRALRRLRLRGAPADRRAARRRRRWWSARSARACSPTASSRRRPVTRRWPTPSTSCPDPSPRCATGTRSPTPARSSGPAACDGPRPAPVTSRSCSAATSSIPTATTRGNATCAAPTSATRSRCTTGPTRAPRGPAARRAASGRPAGRAPGRPGPHQAPSSPHHVKPRVRSLVRRLIDGLPLPLVWGTYVGDNRVLVRTASGTPLLAFADDLGRHADAAGRGRVRPAVHAASWPRVLRRGDVAVDVGRQHRDLHRAHGPGRRRDRPGRSPTSRTRRSPTCSATTSTSTANRRTLTAEVRSGRSRPAPGRGRRSLRVRPKHRGMGTLGHTDGGPAPGDPTVHEVEVVTLDDELSALVEIRLVKIDVEGHELDVLRGMRRLLDQRRVRYVDLELIDRHAGPHLGRSGRRAAPAAARARREVPHPRPRRIAGPDRPRGRAAPRPARPPRGRAAAGLSPPPAAGASRPGCGPTSLRRRPTGRSHRPACAHAGPPRSPGVAGSPRAHRVDERLVRVADREPGRGQLADQLLAPRAPSPRRRDGCSAPGPKTSSSSQRYACSQNTSTRRRLGRSSRSCQIDVSDADGARLELQRGAHDVLDAVDARGTRSTRPATPVDRSEHPLEDVEVVDRVLEQRARPGLGRVGPPRRAVLALDRDVLVVAEHDAHHPAALGPVHRVAQVDERGRVAQHQADLVDHARPPHRVGHGDGRLEVDGQRLLAEHREVALDDRSTRRGCSAVQVHT